MPRLFDSPLWGRGFRPFFLGGALYAALMIPVWVFVFQGALAAPSAWDDPVLWHAHEMIYGFTLAIIAGFLLTAVANWTGGAPVRQMHLAALAVVWAAGRALFWWPGAPAPLLAAVDLAFVPLLALSLAVPLLRARNRRNFLFLGMLSALFLGNLHMHMAARWGWPGDPRLTAYMMVVMVMMIVSLVGGRIIPSFTVAALRMQGKMRSQTDQHGADALALLSLLALIAAIGLCGLDGWLTGMIALASGLVHLWRLRRWHTLETAAEPMLWILHAGYLWLVAGLGALGLYGLKVIAHPSAALHLLTAGCIGSMTLGMMARVALGHTGRPIRAAGPTVAAFWLMQAAALTRVLAIMAGGGDYGAWIMASGLLWTAAFGLYLLVYTRMLLSPRPDGLEA